MMTAQEKYRAAFAVHAPEQTTPAVRPPLLNAKRSKRRLLRPALVAAAVAAVLITGVSAEVGSAAVTNLLAPIFGNAQTELLENIGRPVGASVSADGYTLTAEAIMGTKNSVVVAFTITRDDGEPLPHLCFFDDVQSNFSGTGGGSYWPADDDPTDNQIQYYLDYSFSDRPVPHTMKLSFSNLTQFVQTGEDEYEYTALAEGPWELSFTCRYPDSSRKILAKEISFTDDVGQEYTISSLSVSAFGFRVTGTARFSQNWTDSYLTASVTLTDGSTVALGDANRSFSGPVDGPHQFSWQASYKDGANRLLLSPDQIASITICDVTIPIQ